MWHPNIWRAHRRQCSRPRLSTAPALGELRNQRRSPSPARWSFSVWSQPPWPSSRGRQGASDVVTAGSTFGQVRDPRRTLSGPAALDLPQPLNSPKTSPLSPRCPRDRSHLFHPQRSLTRDVGSSSPSRLNTVGNAPTQRPLGIAQERALDRSKVLRCVTSSLRSDAVGEPTSSPSS